MNASSTVQAVKIKYSPFYEVSWKYDQNINKWLRFKNGKAQFDANDGQQIMSDDVIIQEVNVKVLDDAGRLQVGLVGQGAVRLLRRGELSRGIWKKEDKNSRTRFYSTADEELELVPGKIWVEVVPRDSEVMVTTVRQQ